MSVACRIEFTSCEWIEVSVIIIVDDALEEVTMV
jgi:hypothetical protein